MEDIRWTINRGDTLQISLTAKDADDAVVNLTGYTSVIEVVWPDDERFTLSGVVQTNNAGTIVGSLTAVQTALLDIGKLTKVNLILTFPDASIKTIPVGRIRVRPDD
jgi:hypothetical protein